MKKSIIVLLSILVCAATINIASAKVAKTSATTASAIRLYKAGNYTQAYTNLQKIVQQDPSNGLAYYYLGMTSAQLGKRSEAIDNYEKAIALSPKGILGKYAKKGKTCLQDPLKCNEPEDNGDTEEDKFIKGKYSFSDEARNKDEIERFKNIQREMNRGEELTPSNFKEYKDFSSQAPTNDEIVNALRTLQRAGLGNMTNAYGAGISLIGGNSSASNAGYDMMNMLFSNNGSNQTLSPQVIQALLSNQMTSSF